jgi:hypothetical protein
MKKLTQKQREVLDHMWSAWFARSMTLTDFSRRTVNSLEQAGLISWDAEADAKPGASGPAKFGLTHYGFAVCEREFGPPPQHRLTTGASAPLTTGEKT